MDVGEGGTGETDAWHGWMVVQERVRCSERDTRGEGLGRGGGGLWVVSWIGLWEQGLKEGLRVGRNGALMLVCRCGIVLLQEGGGGGVEGDEEGDALYR